MKLYRTMLIDGVEKLPVVGSQRLMLGVRVPVDIRPDAGGVVHPGRRGMSVTADDPWNLPFRVRPPSHGGVGDDGHVFEIDAAAFAPPLALVPDAPPHHVVAPSESMPLDRYRAALELTREKWSPLR